MRGRAPLSQGSGAGLPTYDLGERGGNANTTLITANLPAAQCTFPATSNDADSAEPVSHALGTRDDLHQCYTSGASDEFMKPGSINGAASIPFSNEPPYLALNYIIALQGTFPSRN